MHLYRAAKFVPYHTMTAAKASTTTANDTHASPFEQISHLEAIQEQRVVDAKEKSMLEQVEAEKTLALTEERQEQELKSAANEELKAYLQNDLAAILQKHEQEMSSEVDSLNATMSKELTKKAESLVADFVKNPSYLLSA